MNVYSPVFLVRISGISLTDQFASDGSRGTRVVSLEHRELGDGGRELKLVLANPGLDLLDDDAFQEGATIEWRFGYPDSLSDLFSAKVSAVEPTFDAYSGLTLTFYAYDAVTKTISINRQVVWTSQNVTVAENDDKVTESEVVTQIARTLGMTADVEPTKDYRTSFAQNDTDWAFMQSLTTSAIAVDAAKRQKYRLWFSADSNTLHFRPAPLTDAPKGVYRYFMETQDPVLLSFSPQVSTTKPDGSGSNTTAAQDVNGDGVVTSAEESSVTAERAALTGYVGASEESGEWTEVPGGPTEVQEVPAAADPVATNPEESQAATAAAGKTLDTLTASLSVIGDPRIRANDIVEIRNVGLRFSGKYLVDDVTHTISGGYITDMTLKRDGTSLQGEGAGTSEEATGANTAESAAPDDDQPAAIAVTSEVTGETEIQQSGTGSGAGR